VNLPSDASGVLTIDLGALADNWRSLNARAAPGRAAAVIKANGYGLGLEVVAPALYAAGCRMFFVAHPTRASAPESRWERKRASTFSTGSRRAPILSGITPRTASRRSSAARKNSRAGGRFVRRVLSPCISTPA